MPTDLEKLKARKAAYVTIFNSPSGKKVLEDLERWCFVHKTTFNNNPQRLAFNEGQRSIYVHIQTMLTMDMEKMGKELEQKPEEG